MEPPIADDLEVEPSGSTEFDTAYKDAVDKIPPPVRLVVEKIAFQIKTQGLDIEDACLLTNVDPDWLATKIEQHPVIARIFRKKELEYRTGLLIPINKKGRVDDKAAQYLLERKEPRTRKNAAGQTEDNGDDMLALAIRHIQQTGDSTPLVRKSSGAANPMAKGHNASRLVNTLKNLLPKGTLK